MVRVFCTSTRCSTVPGPTPCSATARADRRWPLPERNEPRRTRPRHAPRGATTPSSLVLPSSSCPTATSCGSGLHTTAVRSDKAGLADGFKARLQFRPRCGAHLRRLAAGAKVYTTNRTHIAAAELRVPPRYRQRAIAGVPSGMDTALAALERHLDQTRTVRQGMMQQLLAGAVRLPIPDGLEGATGDP